MLTFYARRLARLLTKSTVILAIRRSSSLYFACLKEQKTSGIGPLPNFSSTSVEIPWDKMAAIITMLKLKPEGRASMKGLRIGQHLDLSGKMQYFTATVSSTMAKISTGINKPTDQSSNKKRLRDTVFEPCTF
jgi:hypothetical protein